MNRDQLAPLLRRIKLLCLDVDGVLTDGGLYYTEEGLLTRKFNVKDGLGIKMVGQSGVELAFVSGGKSPALQRRAKDLDIRHVFAGVEDKLAKVSALCRDLGLDIADAAHVGDDLNDLDLMKAVGCPLAVADAVPEVREAALYVTAKSGGDGAVREICDLILASRK